MVHLFFFAAKYTEYILVVITHKMVDGMFPSVLRWSFPHQREWLVLYCDLGRKWKVRQCDEILRYFVTFQLHSWYN